MDQLMGLLSQQLVSNDTVKQVSKSAGLTTKDTSNVMANAMPALLSAMLTGGQQSNNSNMLGSLLSTVANSSIAQTNTITTENQKETEKVGNSILDTILGSAKTGILGKIATATGLTGDKVKKVLVLAAPFIIKKVMSLMSTNTQTTTTASTNKPKPKKEEQKPAATQADLLAALLGGAAQQSQQQPQQQADLLSALLGATGQQPTQQQTNNAGNLLGALLGGQQQTQQQTNNAGNLLGALLGGQQQTQQQTNNAGNLLGALLGGGASQQQSNNSNDLTGALASALLQNLVNKK